MKVFLTRDGVPNLVYGIVSLYNGYKIYVTLDRVLSCSSWDSSSICIRRIAIYHYYGCADKMWGIVSC